MHCVIYTDGGSRGNPGPAGIGVYIEDDSGKAIEKRYKYLGIKTNNEAEYRGAYYGINRALELGATQILLHMDSKLVISQLEGSWKVKDANLKTIHAKILGIIPKDVSIEYKRIPREKNAIADRLSNVAMDKKI